MYLDKNVSLSGALTQLVSYTVKDLAFQPHVRCITLYRGDRYLFTEQTENAGVASA